MTTKSRIFGKINNTDEEVEIIAETELDFIITDDDGWKMGRCRDLGMQKPFTFFREVKDSETCLFISKKHVRLWNQDTKLGELL